MWVCVLLQIPLGQNSLPQKHSHALTEPTPKYNRKWGVRPWEEGSGRGGLAQWVSHKKNDLKGQSILMPYKSVFMYAYLSPFGNCLFSPPVYSIFSIPLAPAELYPEFSRKLARQARIRLRRTCSGGMMWLAWLSIKIRSRHKIAWFCPKFNYTVSIHDHSFVRLYISTAVLWVEVS